MQNPFAKNPFATSGASVVNPFTSVVTEPKVEREEEDVDESYNPEEECKTQYEALVSLPEVHVQAVEDVETRIFEERAKLFRFDKASNSWKERGVGNCFLLQHPETSLIRIFFRQEQTFKIRSNHYVSPTCSLAPHGNSDRSFVWTAIDYADGERSEDILAIRFLSAEVADKFAAEYKKAQDINETLMKPAEPVQSESEEEEVKEEASKLEELTVEPEQE
ncbi:hypothetical protein RCL1_002436 [Eukaryota sp. TZLM3-RCL]